MRFSRDDESNGRDGGKCSLVF